MNSTMEATLTPGTPGELLDFEHTGISYASRSVPIPLDGDSRPGDSAPDHDFDSFVEEQLRDGSGSLFGDATAWMERRLLARVLAQTSGNKSKACQILGITRGSLRHKICQLGISIHQTVSVQKPDRH